MLTDPISSPSEAKIGVGEESGMSDFFGRYGRPTVKLPSVMLEATLSGDILQSINVSFQYSTIKMHEINKGLGNTYSLRAKGRYHGN